MKHPLSDPQLEALAAYEALLRAWAPRLDLISDADVGRLRGRHIDDSLRAASYIARLPAGSAVDVGSGAGLPGVPLAIVGDRPWRLLEPRSRRAAFLEEVVRELGLDRCEVVNRTAEQAAADPGLAATHVVATARALASPPHALSLCLPLVARGGNAILFLGKDSEIPSEADVIEPGLITIRKDAG